MKCPFQSSMVPPCKIESHPDRAGVEYCKVCGEWRYVSEIGNDWPNVTWMLVSVAIVVMLMLGLLRQDPLFRQDDYRRRPNYIGQRAAGGGVIGPATHRAPTAVADLARTSLGTSADNRPS